MLVITWSLTDQKRGVEALSFSAKLVWFSYHEQKSIMVCLEEEREIVFADTSLLHLLLNKVLSGFDLIGQFH